MPIELACLFTEKGLMFACAISTDEFKCFHNVLQANTHSMFVTRPVGLCQCLFPANSLTPVQRCKAIKRRDEGEERSQIPL